MVKKKTENKKKCRDLKRSGNSYLSERINYDIEVVQEICSLIASGGDVVKILEDDRFPNRVSYYRWLNRHPEAMEMHKRAMEIKMHGMVEETVAIADGLKPRVMEIKDDYGNVLRKEVMPDDKEVKRDSLRVSTRQWAAARLASQVYGDKKTVDMKHSGNVKHSLHSLLTGGTTTLDIEAEEANMIEDNSDEE